MTKCWTVVLLLVLTLFQSAHADNISGSAQVYWQSTSIEENEKEKSRRFHQTYTLGLSKAFTSKINFNADVGINTTESDTTKTTRLFPSFRLNVTNEYFDANGGYQLNKRGLDIFGMSSDETRLTNESRNANLSTKSTKYPRLRFRYDENKTYDQLLIHETDTRSERYEATADYTYKVLNFYVKRYNDVTDNFVNDSTQTTTNDEGRVEFSRSLWDNRFTSSGSYRWTEQETESEARGQAVWFRTNPRDANAGLYALDTFPDDGALDDNQVDYGYLIDGTLDDSTIPATKEINIGSGGDTNQNIGAELKSAEEVEEIWIYTDKNYTDNTDKPVEWDVYWADDNIAITTWTKITEATSKYIEDERRFEISLTATHTPTTAKFFKVVNTKTASTSFPNLYVTEIKLFGYTTQDPYTTISTTTTRENIIFNAGLKPVDWGTIRYNFTRDESKNDPDSSKTRQHTHDISARADAELHKFLKAWAQYQTRLEYDTENDRRSTDTYSLHFDSSPLDTLSASLSFNHSVPKIKSKIQSRTTYSLLHIVAKLREGIDLSMDGNLNYTENLVSNTKTFTKSVDSDLRLELSKTLTTEIRYTTNWADTDNSDGTETSDRNSIIRADAYYRPARNFYFRWSYEKNMGAGGAGSTLNQYNIDWVMTEKIRLNINYSDNRNSQDTNSYSSDLTWNLSKIFFLRFGYDWSRQEADTVTKTQTFTGLLSAKF